MKAWANANFAAVIAVVFPPAGLVLAGASYLEDQDRANALRLVACALLGLVIWVSVLSLVG